MFAARVVVPLALVVLGGALSSCTEDALGELRRERDGSGRAFPGRREEDPGPPMVAVGASAEAIRRIAAGTCARRQRCGWLRSDEVACVERVKMDLVGEIHSERCAVDARALDRCVQTIEEEGCDDVLGTFRRALACRRGAICGAR